jgi:hypothetical protein
MKSKDQVEAEVIKTVRQSSRPSEIVNVVRKVSNGSGEIGAKTARQAIRSLIDRGVLQVTLDWKLKA